MGERELIVIDGDVLIKPDLAAWGLDLAEVVSYNGGDVPYLGKRNRVYYILSLSSGGLEYQIELIKKNPGVSQWILLVDRAENAGIWQFEKQLKKLQTTIRVIRTADKTDEEVKGKINAVAVLRERYALICSARGFTGKRTAAELLKHKCPDWEFEICCSYEDFAEKCSQMGVVIIMGRSLRDFELKKPDGFDLSPIFFFNRCDEQLQNCLDSELLWSGIREILISCGWNLPEVYNDFYVGSALYEKWAMDVEENGGAQSLALSDDFVMWDSYGLPLPRDQYTEANIRKFLSRFHALRDISKKLRPA